MKLFLVLMGIIFAPIVIALALLIVALMFSAWAVGFPFHVTRTVEKVKYVQVYRWFTIIDQYTEPVEETNATD